MCALLVSWGEKYPDAGDGAAAARAGTVAGVSTAPANRSERTVRLAGQAPLDRQGGLMHAGDLAAQLALSMAHLADGLARAGVSWADVASLLVRTTDPAGLQSVYDVLTDHLDEQGAAPVITVQPVDGLSLPDMAVCIDAIAVASGARSLTDPPPLHDPHQKDMP